MHTTTLSKLAIFAFVALSAKAQRPVRFVFPSDAVAPNKVRATVIDMLKSACPAEFTPEKLACHPCPNFTTSPGNIEGATVTSVLRGHFLSSESDDVLLNMVGCGFARDGDAGTALMTRDSGQWKLVRYEAGFHACHKLPLPDGRELLVCLSETAPHGVIFSTLSIWDLAAETDDVLLRTSDDTGSCGMDWLRLGTGPNELVRITRESISRVEFAPRDIAPDTLTVTVLRGTKMLTP